MTDRKKENINIDIHGVNLNKGFTGTRKSLSPKLKRKWTLHYISQRTNWKTIIPNELKS